MKEQRGKEGNNGKLAIIIAIAQLAAAAVRLVLAFFPGCEDWTHML